MCVCVFVRAGVCVSGRRSVAGGGESGEGECRYHLFAVNCASSNIDNISSQQTPTTLHTKEMTT